MTKSSFFLFIALFFSLLSCYSVRIVSDCTPESSPLNTDDGFYRAKAVKDTVFCKSGAELTLHNSCGPNGLYALEYRVGLGSALLNMVTFGAVKRVKLRYVCCDN